jgi:hypothetical protein
VGDYSWPSVYWMYSLMTLFAGSAVFFLLRAVQSGAVADDEAPKFRMLADDDAGERGESDGK